MLNIQGYNSNGSVLPVQINQSADIRSNTMQTIADVTIRNSHQNSSRSTNNTTIKQLTSRKNYRLLHKRQLILQQNNRTSLIRSSEYKNLRQVVPSLRRQRDVGKVEVVTEAARYIDHLHKTLIERFILCGIPDSLKGILGTDNANELSSQHIMNLVTSMAAKQHRQNNRSHLTTSSPITTATLIGQRPRGTNGITQRMRHRAPLPVSSGRGRSLVAGAPAMTMTTPLSSQQQALLPGAAKSITKSSRKVLPLSRTNQDNNGSFLVSSSSSSSTSGITSPSLSKLNDNSK